MPDASCTVAAARRAERFAWIAGFAFLSGLPFGIFKDLFPVWLRDLGVSLEAIGVLAGALAAPWSLKVLWAPLVDRWGGRRPWIAGAIGVAATVLAVLALVGARLPLAVLAAALCAFAVASATADIAIDAWTIGVLARDEEGPANGLRVTFYRLSWLVAGGALVALAGPLGWSGALGAAAALLALGALAAPRAPRTAVRRRATGWRPLLRGVVHWFTAPGGLALAGLILLYKWPDAALGPMVRTFWRDAGLSAEQIGALAVPNIGATIAGAWLGAFVVRRLGIVRGLLAAGIPQALSNLAYAAAAVAGAGFPGIVAAATVESLCGGLGTTAFLALLMRVCEKERAAVEFALMTALFAATRDATGAVSGFGVAAFGYAGWFALTALCAVPGLALLALPSIAARTAGGAPAAAREENA
ncbi:MAG: MFS transporter [Acidobacteriota bacterium]